MNRWLESTRCLVIAHRGASAAAPENTLAAFRLAADLGADAIELDVQGTADGQLVIMHDDSVNRTTDGRGNVAELTLEQLRRYDAGVKFGPSFRGERIPLLSEVFDAVAGRLLVDVEVKAAGVEAAALDLIVRAKMADSVLITSFDAGVVARVREMAPQIPIGFLHEGAVDPNTAVSLRAAAYLPEVVTLTADVVATTRRHGLRLITWTVQTEEEARRAIRLGVDGIIADDPVLIQRMLAAK